MPIAHLLELWKKIEVEVEPMETESAADDTKMDDDLEESTNEAPEVRENRMKPTQKTHID